MNTSKRNWFAAVAACSMMIALSGCGGGGGGSTSNPTDPGHPSSYAGTYTGSFQSSIDNGSTQFVVASNAGVSGTVTFDKLGTPTNVSGSVTTGGVLTIHYTAGGNTYTASGALTQSPLNANQFSAVLTVHDDTTNVAEPNAALNVTRS